jgi:transketolase
MHLTDTEISTLEKTANEIRKSIIRSLVEAKSGHTAGPLGMADVFTALYFHSLNHDPKNPAWEDRDRLVLSNGHICPVLYATMAHAGYFPVEELQTLRKYGSRLQGHPHREFLPMVETSSGPLGCGLSQTAGMAIAERMNNGSLSHKHFFCMLGDGEMNEGNNWEAIMLLGKEKLGSVTAIVDRNLIQIDGNTEDIMPLGDLGKKFEEFGWHAQEIDGHNFEEIVGAINRAKAVHDKPSVIVARTIPSKGVKAWEYDYKWHGKPPSAEEGEMALQELLRN